MIVKIKKSDLNRKKTIPFNFGEGHKEYIRRCRNYTLSTVFPERTAPSKILNVQLHSIFWKELFVPEKL